MRFIFAVTVVLISIAPLGADQVTFKNGDRITGSIVKKDANNLTIKGALTGVITVPWDQVEAVQSDSPLNVVLADKTVKATLDASPGQVQLREQHETVTPAQVVAIRNADEQAAYERRLHPGLTQLWTGTATLGFAGTSGNSQTSSFTTAVSASRITNSDKTSIYFNSVRASASVNGVRSTTAEAVRGGWAYSRNMSPRFLLNTFNDYEYDRFQSLDLRFVIGGGAGYSAWKADKGRLDLLAGIAYDHSQFSPAGAAAFTRSSADSYFGDDFNCKLNAITTVTQSFRMFNKLTDSSGYRINFDLSSNTKLKKWLTWTLGFSDRYLSDPAPGHKTNDLLYTMGLGVTFGH